MIDYIKNRIKKMMLFGFVFLLCVGNADAQESVDDKNLLSSINIELADEPAVVIGGVRITIGQAIKEAIKQNHDILSGSYDVAMVDTFYQQLQKKYSLFMTADSGMKYQKNPEAMAAMSGRESTTYDASVGMVKMFSTGTTLSAGVKNEYKETVSDVSYLPVFDNTGASTNYLVPMSYGTSQYNMPILFMSVQQELLKNGFGYNDRRQEKLLKNTAEMQRNMILEALSMVVVGVIVDYWSVATARTQLDNAELQLAETKKLRDIIGRNVRLGLADEFQVNYYSLMVAGSEANVINAQQKYRDAARKFLSAVNMPEDVDITGTVILTEHMPEIDLTSALEAAFSKRADYRNAMIDMENANMQLEMETRNSLPSLTAELNMYTLGQREGVTDSYSDAASMSYPSIEARIKLTYPLDDREQEINERNANFRLKQAKINLDKIKRSVRDDIKSKIEKMQTTRSIYGKSKEARVQAERFYSKMLVNLRRGRLDSATVKNGLDAMISSRQQELEALVYYNITLLQFDVAKNELWEKYRINVDDYIPKYKQ